MRRACTVIVFCAVAIPVPLHAQVVVDISDQPNATERVVAQYTVDQLGRLGWDAHRRVETLPQDHEAAFFLKVSEMRFQKQSVLVVSYAVYLSDGSFTEPQTIDAYLNPAAASREQLGSLIAERFHAMTEKAIEKSGT